MHSTTYHSILRCLHLLQIDYTNYESLLQCYLYAALTIKANENAFNKYDVFSDEFESMCHQYDMTERPGYIYDVAWFPDLCTELVQGDLQNDHRAFLNTFTPFIVAQWDLYQAEFYERDLDALVALYHILKTTREAGLSLNSISDEQIRELHNRNRYLNQSLSSDAFLRCWKAVYCIPMPRLDVPVRRNLVEAVRLYRKHKVPGICLLKNYCLFKWHPRELEDAFNPWEEFHRSIRKDNAVTGISIEETVFNAVSRILKEKPSDLVRVTLYPYPELFGRKGGEGIALRNDGRFECSFLMTEFENAAASAKQILIVDPGPDFLVAWSKKADQYAYHCTVAVPNHYVAMAYRSEYKGLKFCLFSDVENQVKKYDIVAIISTNTAEDLDLNLMANACKDGGQIFALLPQTMLTQEDNHIGNLLKSSGCQVHKIISIATNATVSTPRKKMLLLAQRSSVERTVIPVFFTHCGEDGNSLLFDKEYIHIYPKQLTGKTTLEKLRRKAIAQKEKHRSIDRRNSALTYDFSEEIGLRYTIHRDKHGSLVGEAYYRGHQKGDRWNSNVTQKGLRSKDQQVIVDRLEQVAYYPTVNPCIVNDLLDYYADKLEQCSLKTIWFCCREKLLRHRSYDDVLAQSVLFQVGSPLSVIHPGIANENDYRDAMQSVIPADSNAIVKYWKQLNIIMRTAVEEAFVRFNPIPALLPEVSKKASKQLQNIRNMLTKKTLTLEEESRILAFITEETSADFGPHKAKRFEVESIWLLGAIHLFTGMSTREACALTWEDFNKIAGLDAYQLEVYKFLQDDGSISYQIDEKTSKYNYRKVPVAPLLAKMLLSRYTYLQAVLGYAENQLKTMPIIMAKEYKNPNQLPEKLFCKISKATAVCRQLIQKAEIPVQELILPGSGEDLVLDMNKYQGDIFYSNFKHRANHACAFLRGELSYALGNKAPDTFSQHYCDYSNDLAQYSMVQKLQRWTYLHEYPPKKLMIASETTSFTRKSQVVTNFFQERHNAVEITLTAKENIAGSYLEIEAECDHGVTGSVTVMATKEKEVNRL